VSPFLGEYEEQEDVKICTALTAVTLQDTGETIIIRFGQALDFTSKLEKTLVNPNQLRAFGVPVCDDPTDPFRELGIQLDSDLFLPMSMDGTICGVMTRCPTDEELKTCRIFTVSDVDDWDPARIVFDDGCQVKHRYSPLSDRIVYSFRSNITEPNTNPRLDHESLLGDEYDCALSEISPIYHPNRLVSAVSTAYAAYSEDRHHAPGVDSLALKWGISKDSAKATLQATTQLSVRSAILPLTRRYRTDLLSQRLRRLNSRFFTDTLFAKSKSIIGNSCAQIFTNAQGFLTIIPIASKSEAGATLDEFVQDVGIPNELVFDGASEQSGKKTQFMRSVRHYRINWRMSEPFSPWQNKAETAVRIVKQRWKRLMVTKSVPVRLWDFALSWICQIYSRTAFKGGRTGWEIVTGDTPDISEWTDFSFYDLVWYWHDPGSIDNPCIGRWLGVSHRVGSALCYWILTSSCKVVARTTVQHITDTDLAKDDVKGKILAYTSSINQFLGENAYVTDLEGFASMVNEDVPDPYIEWRDGMVAGGEMEPDPLSESIPDIDDAVDGESSDVFGKYIGADILIHDNKDQHRMARVIRQLVDRDMGNGTNPLLDHSLYEIEFCDGTTDRVTANFIAENILSQVDSEGYHYQIMSEIVDHRKLRSAIPISDGFILSRSGNKVPKKTTRGWELLVEWKDGSTSWVSLSDLKSSNPVELAEYAVANEIQEEPAFKWWVRDVLRMKERIISKVKSKYLRTTHKFGIQIPKSVREAYEIDRQTGTDFWTKAIAKEMAKVRVAFERTDISPEEMRKGQAKPGYQEIKCHWVFDIKLDGNFTRKARLVAGGHMTNEPSSVTYSSVVSRDSVRIALMLAALNDLDVYSMDVSNAYLYAPCREKIWIVAGIEFGSDAGSVMLIVRALYGLKTSGASWHSMLSQSLRDLGYKASEADRNVWLKPGVKADGFRYYQMVLVYVDDILHVSHDTSAVVQGLKSLYQVTEDALDSPGRYLGANIGRVQTPDGRAVWAMSSTDYVLAAIANVEASLKSEGLPPLKVYGKCKRPYPTKYRPELDSTDELNAEGAHKYQELIGVLRWAVELGRIDILVEVSCLSQYLCSPRKGHLDAVYHIFRYLQYNMKKNKGILAFDPLYIHVDEDMFAPIDTEIEYWKELYPDAQEVLPNNMPEPLGNPVCIHTYVDANHAGNLANRRSHSGILIYVNNAPIIWFSKRQNTVESSSFGSEFVALRIAVELVEALRYKLRMFGVPIDGSANMYCDNKSVVTNASIPTSVLNKRHNAICYHKVRESQAAGTIRVGWIPGEQNLADLFTKTTMPGNVRNDIVETIFMNGSSYMDTVDT
jgi:ribosomal protein L31E